VEGGSEVNASFLMRGLAHRVEFFYAPMILGGRNAVKAVGGRGAESWEETLELVAPRWRKVGGDLWLSARVQPYSNR
jgi:diaminohydroxyphosphoribosylaminopyrimidine deaminase/5-amino-6-(5-phosphoribosylamino)uracil reductase